MSDQVENSQQDFSKHKSTFAFALENTQDRTEYEGKKTEVIKFINGTSSREIFKCIFDEWLVRPHSMVDYVTQNEDYVAVLEKLRTDSRLGRVASYVSGASDEPQMDSMEKNVENDLAERLMIGEMMTLLENVWISLDFQDNFLHPVHKGWLTIFHRWTSNPVFEHHWFNDNAENKVGIQNEFSPGFQRFIETIRRIKSNAKDNNGPNSTGSL